MQIPSITKDYSSGLVEYLANPSGPAPVMATYSAGSSGYEDLASLSSDMAEQARSMASGVVVDSALKAMSVEKELSIRGMTKADYYALALSEASKSVSRESAAEGATNNCIKGIA